MRFVRYITISLMALLLATVTLSVSAGDALLAFEVPEYSVLVGKTVKPKVIPQGIEGKLKYEWASSDEEVATVKAGTVKGVSSGTATLICRATSVDGTSYEAQCRIVVNIPITSIKVKESTVELGPAPFFAAKLDANKHYYLHAPSITIILENAAIKDIQWTSSNKKLAE